MIFPRQKKEQNLARERFIKKIEREEFFDFLKTENPQIDFIYHLGARTDTTEFDYSIHEHLNVDYSKKIWNYSSEKKCSAGLCLIRCNLRQRRIGL